MMSNYQRQHPLMILVQFITHVKSLVLPIIFGFLISSITGEESGGSPIYLYIVLGIFAVTLVYDVFGWIFYRYALKDDALNVKSGVFIKKRRHIKRARIQATSLEAGLVHRALGILSLRVETAGSKMETEFKLAALKPKNAKAIQQYLEGSAEVDDAKQGSVSSDLNQDNTPREQFELDNKMLLIAGLTSGGIGFVFSIVGFIFSQVFIFIPDAWLDRFYDSVFALSVFFIVLLVVLLFIISWIISIFRYASRFAFFTLLKQGDELIIERGLFVKKTLRLKQHRIQAVSVSEGLLRQMFKLATIELEVAGGSEYETDFKITLIPVFKRHQIQALLTKFLPDYAINFTLKPLPKRALRRYIIRASLPFIVVIIAGFITPYAWLGFLLLPVSVCLGYMRYQSGGFYIDHNHLVQRSRVIARNTVIVQRRHMQSMHFYQTIFQRFRRLLTTAFTVMSSPSHKTFQLKDIDFDDFQTLSDWYIREK